MDDCRLSQPCIHWLHYRVPRRLRRIPLHLPTPTCRRRPLAQPSPNIPQRLALHLRNRLIHLARRRAQIRAMEPVADRDGLLGGALAHVEVGGDGSVAPGVALAVGEEEARGGGIPAAVSYIGGGDVGRRGTGEGFGEPVCALALEKRVSLRL